MSFSSDIIESDAGPLSLRLLPSKVESVVTFVGSFETRPDLALREDLVQELLVDLLDKGTTERDRFEIARAIEDRGADVGFGSNGLRIVFSGRALRRDVADILDVVAEQVKFPALDEGEFEKSKLRFASSIQRSIDNTGVRAKAAITGRIFPIGHPNHGYDPAADLEALGRITLDDVRCYHKTHFAADRMVLCAAGDLEPDMFERFSMSSFSDWAIGEPREPITEDVTDGDATTDDGNRIDIEINDRRNLDIMIGTPVSMRRDDPDFVALHVGNYVLGGNFSARLMSHVREDLGLTYGIGSSLAGFDRRYCGWWRIYVTLSQENLAAGIDATMNEVSRFVRDGITSDELDVKKRTLNGLYQVGLATTRGLAQTMHAHFEHGFDASYIDTYPQIVRELTVDEVNASIEHYLNGRPLTIAVAGTLPEP